MQLGKLRSAIRAHKGAINVEVALSGRTVKIPVQKMGFLNDVLPIFADGNSTTDETGLSYDDGLVFATDGASSNFPEDSIDLTETFDPEEELEFEDLFG